MPEAITATVGWSERSEALLAGKEAAESALRKLSSLKPKLAIVFGSSWFNQPQLLQGIRSVLGQLPLVGQSTAGEIVSRGPISHSCVVLLIASDVLTCSVGLGERVDRAPREAGQQAAYAAVRQFRGGARVGCLLFGEGLVTSYADVVRGIQEILGTSFLIAGGMAGDDLQFAQTYQYFNHRVLSQAVVGVLLGGSIQMGVGIEHGFAPISRPRRITRAHANILYELDQQPAASVYEEYFGPDVVQRMRTDGSTRQGIAYPLGIQPETTDYWLLRNVVSFGEDGSLSCSGEILEGSWLQLMIGNKKLALEAASKAAQQAMQSLNRVGCVLVFDSATRRKLLGFEHAAREIACIREAVGPSTPLVGCYTYGEQAPCSNTTAHERMAVQTGSVLVVALGT
ncbi:MAG: FIST C-terminal domain-containing protein [Candidatus Omnitrophica bacterium]|nr:FIST C-terminal domain-containing protein [Candidatus Omnitrophota bacterium]MBI3021617.1 FIST C-terminal domain-containing protein [Candidatus Omnitrophota bacterium]